MGLFLALSLLAAPVTVTFKGNKTFSDKELYEKLGIAPVWWKRLLFHKKPHVDEKLLPILLDEIKAFYKDQGFWDVKVDLALKDRTVTFIIQENSPITIHYIAISSDFPIVSLIPLHRGERFIASAFKASKQKIKKALLKKGYCSYDFDPKAYIFSKRHSAYLVYALHKGDPCIIKNIQITGLESIDKKVILSHIYLRPKELFSLEKVNESYRKLYSLGYFRFLNIDYSKKIENQILLDIDLKERKKRNIYKVGLGYDTLNGIHASWYYKNLNYHQLQPTFKAYYSSIKKGIDFTLFVPSVKLHRWYLDSVGSIGYEHNDFDSFTQRSRYVKMKLLKEFFDLSFSFAINAEMISITSKSDCLKSGSYAYLYPSLFLLYDKRDSKIAPQKGYFIKDKFKPFTPETISNEATLGVFYPFSTFTLFAKATLGTIFAESISPDKLFYAGGAKSNRAYTYRQLHALDSPCNIGGKSLLDTTIEARYRYNEAMDLAFFWDRTYLSSKELHFSASRDGVGVGLIYRTPLGELKAYFGLDPSNPSQNAINLYLGASF